MSKDESQDRAEIDFSGIVLNGDKLVFPPDTPAPDTTPPDLPRAAPGVMPLLSPGADYVRPATFTKEQERIIEDYLLPNRVYGIKRIVAAHVSCGRLSPEFDAAELFDKAANGILDPMVEFTERGRNVLAETRERALSIRDKQSVRAKEEPKSRRSAKAPPKKSKGGRRHVYEDGARPKNFDIYAEVFPYWDGENRSFSAIARQINEAHEKDDLWDEVKPHVVQNAFRWLTNAGNVQYMRNTLQQQSSKDSTTKRRKARTP